MNGWIGKPEEESESEIRYLRAEFKFVVQFEMF